MIGNETLKQLEIKTDEFVMKPNFGFVLRGTVAFLMGFVLLFVLLRFEPETAGTYSKGDIGEILTCLVCMVGFWVLGTVDTVKNGITVVVDRNGVCGKGLFSRKSFSWAEVRDYGCFYDRYIRSLDGMYVVYFSPDKLNADKTGRRKKIGGKAIRTYLSALDACTAVDSLLPFCRRFAGCEPFLSDTDYLKKWRSSQ